MRPASCHSNAHHFTISVLRQSWREISRQHVFHAEIPHVARGHILPVSAQKTVQLGLSSHRQILPFSFLIKVGVSTRVSSLPRGGPSSTSRSHWHTWWMELSDHPSASREKESVALTGDDRHIGPLSEPHGTKLAHTSPKAVCRNSAWRRNTIVPKHRNKKEQRIGKL